MGAWGEQKKYTNSTGLQKLTVARFVKIVTVASDHLLQPGRRVLVLDHVAILFMRVHL